MALDNQDSFTFTLVDYCRRAGADVTVARSDEIGLDEALELEREAIMVSPGPGRPEDAGISVDLAREAIARRIPFLGICLGHQALALACGSETAHVAPVHGKVAKVRHDGTGLFSGLPSPLDATRYHSIAVPEPKPPLIANAWAENGLVMAMRHADAPAHGIQFHPESIASSHGLDLIAAFVDRCAAQTA
ncbi:anthranilate synthase component II [Sphingomicrobium sediminis]|uniref:Aminodeoxychorismate/anthranilate synthase component II n=1 Tax=Sphingomicrobium sediminis TaxID=2950949 RepID=A0A9X2J2G4_9SPHN|nr:aminodeoxychorismate/anthranilate synthase component II [Sphingomicrobium sediminis]MCM8557005.1 aminodeoxychorismate/anthranilate synthase component II [Sphingomicrobium sediminis]